MNLLSKALSSNAESVVPAPQNDQKNADYQRERLVTNKLLLTALGGLFAFLSAICTTMIEVGTLWRDSWLALCIAATVVMFVGLFGMGSAIGRQED
jgi:hypothetical protein